MIGLVWTKERSAIGMDWQYRRRRTFINEGKEAEQAYPGALSVFQGASAFMLCGPTQLFIQSFQSVTDGVGCQRTREEITRLGKEDDHQAHDDACRCLVKGI